MRSKANRFLLGVLLLACGLGGLAYWIYMLWGPSPNGELDLPHAVRLMILAAWTASGWLMGAVWAFWAWRRSPRGPGRRAPILALALSAIGAWPTFVVIAFILYDAAFGFALAGWLAAGAGVAGLWVLSSLRQGRASSGGGSVRAIPT